MAIPSHNLLLKSVGGCWLSKLLDQFEWVPSLSGDRVSIVNSRLRGRVVWVGQRTSSLDWGWLLRSSSRAGDNLALKQKLFYLFVYYCSIGPAARSPIHPSLHPSFYPFIHPLFYPTVLSFIQQYSWIICTFNLCKFNHILSKTQREEKLILKAQLTLPAIPLCGCVPPREDGWTTWLSRWLYRNMLLSGLVKAKPQMPHFRGDWLDLIGQF